MSDQVNESQENKIKFVVTGQGRSGTLWLARLLNRDPNIIVHHEPGFVLGRNVYANFFRGIDPIDYLIKRRKKILRYVEEVQKGIPFAEVNGYLRYCVPGLRKIFRVPIVAIIRDGRYVVRSMLHGGTYSHPGYPPVAAIAKPWCELWPSMDAFSRTCWYWADTYRRLLKQNVPYFYLERLNKDWEYVIELCEQLGVQLDEQEWRTKFAGHRVNIGVQTTELPDWDLTQRKQFEEFAGDIQEHFYGSEFF